MTKNKWKLWKENFLNGNMIHYVWTEDNIIRHSRIITKLGFINAFRNPDVGYIGFNVNLERFNFKPVKTKMNQEELSKGWLL